MKIRRLIGSATVIALTLGGLITVGAPAQAVPVTGTDTSNSTDIASVEILMGSEVAAYNQGSSKGRSTISEVNTAGWTWLDATADREPLLTWETTPGAEQNFQNVSDTTLYSQFYAYARLDSVDGYYRNAGNKINKTFDQSDGLGEPINWTSQTTKLPGDGGFLARVGLFNGTTNLPTAIPNARFRVQLLGKGDNTNGFHVLGADPTPSSQFSLANSKPSFTFYDCDPSTIEDCAPIAAVDTPGGLNPTQGTAGEAYAQANAEGYAYVWVTMAGVAASNLFDFQLRVSDAGAEDTTLFPDSFDYSHIFPAYVEHGAAAVTPDSVYGVSSFARTAPWVPGAPTSWTEDANYDHQNTVTSAGKRYSSVSFFKLNTSGACLWGSTLADASQSTAVITPTPLEAGDGDSTLTVTVNSMCGTPLAGQIVTVQVPDGEGGFTTVELTTGSNGQATMAIIDTGLPWTDSFPVTLGEGTDGPAIDSPTMEYVAPAPNAGNTTIEIDESEITADGETTATVTVAVKDKFGNPVGAGVAVCLSLYDGDGNLSNGPWVTDADGNVTATVTSPTYPSSGAIEAYLGGCETEGDYIGEVTIDYVAGPADGGSSTIEIDEITSPADGVTPTNIYVQVLDQFGNIVAPGTPVCLVLTDGTGTLGEGPWETDADGNVMTTITSPTATGSGTVTAYLGTCDEYGNGNGDEIGDVSIDYLPGPASAPNSTIEIDKTENSADGTSEATVTVNVVDQFGNVVEPGTEICLVLDGAGTLGDGPWFTDENGDVIGLITAPNEVGTGTITAYLGACGDEGDEIGSVSIDFVPEPNAENSELSADKTTAPADGSSAVTVKVLVLDQFGDPVAPGTPICLALTDGTGTLGDGPWETDADGNVTGIVTAPSEAGSAVITAWLGDCDNKGDEVGTVAIAFTAVPASILASAGVNGVMSLMLAVLMLLAGAGALLVSRRRTLGQA